MTREISRGSNSRSALRHRRGGLIVAGICRGLETGPADQPDRALGRGRLDRSDHPARRRRDGKVARPDHCHHQPAPKDGYTWTAGAAQDLGAYQTLGSLDSSIKDWHLFLSVANVQVIGVNPKTPYQSAKELLDAMKANPGKISVATAGVTSAGHNAMELIAKVDNVKYRHVTYDGGNPAVVATVSGEAEVTTQLAVEQADMIRGKRLRPLATVSDKPLELEGYGTIPPLSQTLPGFAAPTNYFGIFIPKGVPDEVIATVEKIWKENISNSEAVKKYATSRGALFAPSSGEAAQKAVFPAVQANAWLLFDTGKAKVSPDTVGIPKI
jgi:tripartite-type tricarboxylate transporter receptor subunit TctC